MDVVTLLIVQAIAFLLLLMWLKRRVDRELSADRALEEVRKEVGDLITELNATTERNITLIEDRVQRLNRVLETTDRKIGILKKEAEKHELGAATYSDILKQRRRSVSPESVTPTQRAGAPLVDARGSQHTGSPHTDTAGRDDYRQPGASGSAEQAARVTGTTDSTHARSPQPASTRGEGLRNQVRDLHRAGLGAEAIAKRLGSTVGEVELIIGLQAGEASDYRGSVDKED